jgi:RND superfamily putative drug exporter
VLAAPRRVLLATLAFLAVAAFFGGTVAANLSAGGFDDPDAEAVEASRLLEQELGGGAPNLVLLVTAPGSVDDPAAAAAGTRLAERLAAEPGVVQVTSYWTTGADPLRNEDGDQALVLARITGSEDEQIERVEELGARFNGAADGLRVELGGEVEVFRQVGDTIERDLKRAEAIVFPITAVLLVLVFGSAVAAGLPLLVGVLSILGTFLSLQLLNGITDVSVYSVNLAIAMGLGLGIDYSLFMITRYREERQAGHPDREAVLRTVRTAGRTVLFSAITVLLSLSALLVFPLYFLNSFAYAGISAVVFAALGAIVVLPAALVVLGSRIDALDLSKPLRRLLRLPAPRPRTDGEGFWHRVAVAVMRRPLPIATVVLVLLVTAGLPFSQVVFGLPDDRGAAARGQRARHRAEDPRRVPSNEPLAAVGWWPPAPDLPRTRRRRRPVGGRGVGPARRRPGGRAHRHLRRREQVAPGGAGLSPLRQRRRHLPQRRALRQRLRAGGRGPGARAARLGAPFDDVVVGGSGGLAGRHQGGAGRRPPARPRLIAVATLVLLFLFTGSVVLPVKAVVLNLLSLSATFGAMVWIFQEGNLTWLIGDPITTGTLDTTMPILMFCVLFGLSMDYEVFLLSRIREEWLRTGDNQRAVALGLERTGRLITAAAGLLALVFLGFVSSDISFIKLLGLGTALAVVVDATLVRGVLVPAFMRVAGPFNWWAPAPLRRLHERVGLTEADLDDDTGAVTSTDPRVPAGV